MSIRGHPSTMGLNPYLKYLVIANENDMIRLVSLDLNDQLSESTTFSSDCNTFPTTSPSVTRRVQVNQDVGGIIMAGKYTKRSLIFVGVFLCHWTNASDIFRHFGGALFWPTVPAYIDEVIQALTEKKYPS